VIEAWHNGIVKLAPVADQSEVSCRALPHERVADSNSGDVPIAGEDGSDVADCAWIDDWIRGPEALRAGAREQDMNICEVGEACEVCEKLGGERLRGDQQGPDKSERSRTSSGPYTFHDRSNPN
jgi:hypothetical protein